jgi:hypothetical protein
MKNITYIIIVSISLLCCGKGETEINNKYQIISLLYEEMLRRTDYPPILPPPPPLSNKGKNSQEYLDSLDVKYVNSIRKMVSESFSKKELVIRKIVAISPKLKPSKDLSSLSNVKFEEFKLLLGKFNLSNESENIDISKIYTPRKDSLVYFKKDLLETDSREFTKFDFLFSFSNIVFSKEYDKAIIICSGSRSRLAGVSIMFFLIKTKNGRWVIKYEKELSIS